MLEIETLPQQYFDDETERFIEFKGGEILVLEHSLYTISKWESKWEIPFIDHQHTTEQIVDYIRCMVISGDIPEPLEYALSSAQIDEISRYINAKMSATTVTLPPSKGSREIITSEIVYYWMISLNIPLECEHWHFQRLMMLIQVANAKNNPKKMSRADAMAKQRELNEQRRKQFNTSG